MSQKNLLAVVAQAKDETSGPLEKATRAYEAANKAAAEADKKVTEGTKAKRGALKSFSEEEIRVAAAAKWASQERARLIDAEIAKWKERDNAAKKSMSPEEELRAAVAAKRASQERARLIDAEIAKIKEREEAAEKAAKEASRTFGDKVRGVLNTDVSAGVTAGLKAVGAAAALATAAIAGTGAMMWKLATGAANAGDEALTLSQRLGVSSEFITRIGFAARQSGTDIGGVERAISGLTMRAMKNAESFRRWGVEVKESNGNLKSSEALFMSALEVIAGLENETQRAAAAQDIFGKAGKDLHPIVAEGTEGLRAMMQQADELGVTISEVDAIAGDKFNDTLGAMSDGLEASARIAGSVFMPVFTEAMEASLTPIGALNRGIEENKKTLQRLARDGLAFAARTAGFFVDAIGFTIEMVDNARQSYLDATLAYLKFQKAITFDKDKLAALAREMNQVVVSISDLTNAAEERQKAIYLASSFVDDLANKIETLKDEDISGAKAADEHAKARDRDTDATKRAVAAKKAAAKAAKESAKEMALELELAADMMQKAEQRAGGWRDMMAPTPDGKKTAEQEKREAQEKKEKRAEEKRELTLAKAEAKQTADEMKQAAHEVAGTVTDVFRMGFRAAMKEGEDFGENLVKYLQDLALRMLESGLMNLLTNLLTGGGAGAAGGLASGVLSMIGFAEGGLVPSPAIAAPKVVRMAGGGIISGGVPGVDSVPVLAQQDEGFLSRRLTRELRRTLSVPEPSRSSAGPSSGSGGGVTVLLQPSYNTPSLPDQTQIDRHNRDVLLPSLKRLHASGQLNFIK